VKIDHGGVNIMPYNTFGAVASYACDDGWELDGTKARVCQGDETWSGVKPRCTLKDISKSGQGH
jgi:hypothetical protein